MAIKIEYRFGASIPGGPSVNVKQGPIEVGAYDVVSATLPPEKGGKPSDTTVEVQPAGKAGAVLLFVISADTYADGVTYDVDGKGRALNGPLLLVGSGAVTLLGPTPPETLTFHNATTNPVQVQVLVGRQA